MTTVTKPELSNKEAFIKAAKAIISDAVSSGTNMSRIRALRNYMAERLADVAKDEIDAVKATIIGEMFATHDVAGPAIVAFAKEKAGFKGTECGPAMAAIVVEHGIYSPTAEIWMHVAGVLTASKKNQKDYMDLRRALRAELRSVADKANNQMNALLEEMGKKDKPTGKKGGRGGKSKGEVVEGTVVVSAGDATNLQNLATLFKEMTAEDLKATASILVATMLQKGLTVEQITDALEGPLCEALESSAPATAQPVAA